MQSTLGWPAAPACYNLAMSGETVPQKTANESVAGLKNSGQSGAVVSPVLHRVCIQCNNMFIVPPDKFDAKHCPACHKG